MASYTEKVTYPEIDRPNFNAPLLKVTWIALAVTVAIMCSVVPFKNSFIRDLLIGRDEIAIDRVIFQGLTIFMWAMSLGTVLVKKRQLARELRALKEELIPRQLEIGDERALVRAFTELVQRPDFKHSIVVSRVARVLGTWINTRDFDRTVQIMKEESELDMFHSDASFRANRLYIWAMPLLGFVGTVYGVSYGIGGFAEFLKGQVTGDQIKEQVGIITEGLAVAFYTTLVGLLTAGAAAFPSLGAERKEEHVLGSIDELLEEQLIARLPSLRSEFPLEHIRAIRTGVESLATGLSEQLTTLAKAIVGGFGKMPSPQVYERVFAQAIASAGGIIHEQYHQFALQYEQKIAQLGDQLTQRIDRVSDTLQRSGEQQSARQREHVDALCASLDHVRDGAVQMREATQTASEQLGASLSRVTETGARIEQLIQATRAMEGALHGLAGTEAFRASMEALRVHLEANDAALRRLSRPRRVIFEESTCDSTPAMRRKPKAKVDIDVVPYLSIMVIVLKLITLILIVQVIPIALNPSRYKVLSFEDLFTSRKLPPEPIKVPTYFDCRPDQMQIIPGQQIVSFTELREAGNPVEQALTRLANHSTSEYAVIIVRPRSVQVYRHLRKMLTTFEGLSVGYDVLESDRVIDWEAEAKRARLELN